MSGRPALKRRAVCFHWPVYTPCPFSPYSDINVRDTSLKEAMNSRLFRELRDGGYLLEDHPGGCTLYERRTDVERIMADSNR